VPLFKEEVESEVEVKKPSLYRVILHNDDYTTMEFVVDILRNIFLKSEEEAINLMLMIHNQGRAICGVYTHEIAQTKAEQVIKLARQNSFPLLATIEIDE
jgi:ATP-dependent Clp protease adaptor protein ClpS